MFKLKEPLNYTNLVYGNPYSYNIGVSRIISILIFNIIAAALFSLSFINNNLSLEIIILFSTFVVTLTMLKPLHSHYNIHALSRGKDRKFIVHYTILAVLVLVFYMKYLNYNNKNFDITDPRSIIILLIVIFLFSINAIKTQIRTYKSNKDGRYPKIFNSRKILVVLICLAMWKGVFYFLN